MNGEVFVHWAKEPFTFDPEHKYQWPDREPAMKPKGFWFDVEGDWKRWCEAEGFRLEYLGTPHEVIVDEGRCLRLCTAGELDRFTKEYTLGTWELTNPVTGRSFDVNRDKLYLGSQRRYQL